MDARQAAARAPARPGGGRRGGRRVLVGASGPLVITGRGARGAAPQLVRLLDATGALYLDTQESRGLVPADHPAFVGAVRGAADDRGRRSSLLIGRKLDYQLGYGSPAVFPHARFIRIADNAGELIDNRRGQPELLASPALALAAMVEAAGNRAPALDKAWAEGLRRRHRERSRHGVGKPSAGDAAATARSIPRAIFDAIAEHGRSGLHRDRRWRRPARASPASA